VLVLRVWLVYELVWKLSQPSCSAILSMKRRIFPGSLAIFSDETRASAF
jgi:hypothetical protein